MEYDITLKEQLDWLLKARKAGKDFGVLDFKVEASSMQEVHLIDVKSTKAKKAYCGKGYTKKQRTTFIDALLKGYTNDGNGYCWDCFEEALNLSLEYIEEILFSATNICTYAERIQTKDPEKYSPEWEMAIKCYYELSYYKNDKEAKEQGILQDALWQAEEMLEEYLTVNESCLSDAKFIDTIITKGRLWSLPPGLHPLGALGIPKGEKFNNEEKFVLKTFIKADHLHTLVEKLPDKPTLKQTDYPKFKDWVIAEAVENEVQRLEKLWSEHFEKKQTISRSILKSSMSLVKNEVYAQGYQNTLCAYLCSLGKVKKGTNANGILIPTKLVSLLKGTLAWPQGLINLGVVKADDTLEILETALSLDLGATKALKAARLLHKES